MRASSRALAEMPPRTPIAIKTRYHAPGMLIADASLLIPLDDGRATYISGKLIGNASSFTYVPRLRRGAHSGYVGNCLMFLSYESAPALACALRDGCFGVAAFSTLMPLISARIGIHAADKRAVLLAFRHTLIISEMPFLLAKNSRACASLARF